MHSDMPNETLAPTSPASERILSTDQVPPAEEGGWLPRDRTLLDKWLAEQIAYVRHHSRQGRAAFVHSVVDDFKAFIESTPDIRKGFLDMFSEVPQNVDPKLTVQNYTEFLQLLDKIIAEAPPFNANISGLPINAILIWPMGTAAGRAMFTDPRVNRHLKQTLNTWAEFLQSENSRAVLNTGDHGWLSENARKLMPLKLEQTIDYDPNAAFAGFSSWDHFFTRRYKPEARPVAFPNDNRFINSPCEGTVYRIGFRVSLNREFWAKGQPYSLANMLNDHPSTKEFEEGRVVQLYLSPFDYHRWHAPVDGVIEDIVNVDGTYYAAAPDQGFPNADKEALYGSVPYLSAVATRAIIFIKADSPLIGSIALIAIGMVEVSSCVVTVKKGAKVKKGDQLGSFHFGGSTFCMIFQKKANIIFTNNAVIVGTHLRVNLDIGRAYAPSD